MPLPIVIVHGWSDNSNSFKSLAAELAQYLNVDVTTINLADWISMDDNVTYDDVVTQMDRAWNAKGLPRQARSVDVIVHSTGALVVRDWLIRNFSAPTQWGQATPCPIHHFVMCAPANFGSPLAHKGTSFMGRVIKGWNKGAMFQVGALILKGLELGSTYTWNLALKDRFGEINFYDKYGALTTVIVGNTGWSGISAAANEDGTDGTVRVSTANLNCTLVRANFPETPDGAPPAGEYRVMESNGRTAFVLLNGINHSESHDPKIPEVLSSILEALQVTDDNFYDYCGKLDIQSAAILEARENESKKYYWGYQNAVFFVRDHLGLHVKDYFIEFYDDRTSNILEEIFHRDILRDVHPFSDDPAFRSMLLDITTLRREFADNGQGKMKISLTAHPEFTKYKAGYRTFSDKDIGAVTLDQQKVDALFRPNRTAMIEITLHRYQKPEVFTF